MPGPVAGRRELMMATRANLEPILLVYNGGESGADSLDALDGPGAAGTGGHGGPAGPASRLVDLAADERPPLVSAVTSDGITHRLWRLTDPAEHADHRRRPGRADRADRRRPPQVRRLPGAAQP